MPESRWWALAEVAPASAAAEFPDGMVGAFVGVAGPAESMASFADRVRATCVDNHLLLIDLEDVRPLEDQDDIEDELVDALANEPDAIAFGAFHMYPEDELN